MAHFKRSLTAIPVFGLSFALVAGLGPVPALAATSAELQQQLDSASEQLNSLYSAAEQASNDLITVNNELESTKQQIQETEAKIAEEEQQLAAYQSELSDLVSTQYKSGGSASIVSVLLNSGSFTNLISNLHYADKAAEHKQDVIASTHELMTSLEQSRADLEEQKAEQEKLVADQQEKADAAAAAASDAQAYYDQLSDELKAQIAAEEEAARQAAAEEAARREQEQGGNGGGADTGGGTGGTTDNGGSSGGGNTGGGGGNTSGGGGNTSSGGGGGSSSGPTTSASNMVARAQSIIGSGYSYSGYYWSGSTSTSWFTCSGVVDYALGLSSQSNSPESLMAKVKARGTWTTSVSELKYGDLVFFTTSRYCGHVGIYIGGGEMIDSIPGSGVGYRTLSYIGGFIGGGSIV